jgi:hypothetical protein
MQPGEPSRPPREWAMRLVWFVLLWAAGVAVVGTLALVIRKVLL